LYTEYFYPEARFSGLPFHPVPIKRLWIDAIHRVTKTGLSTNTAMTAAMQNPGMDPVGDERSYWSERHGETK